MALIWLILIQIHFVWKSGSCSDDSCSESSCSSCGGTSSCTTLSSSECTWGGSFCFNHSSCEDPTVRGTAGSPGFGVSFNGAATTAGGVYSSFVNISGTKSSLLTPDVPLTLGFVETTLRIRNEDCNTVAVEWTITNTGLLTYSVGICLYAPMTLGGSTMVNWDWLEGKHGIYASDYSFYLQTDEPFNGTYTGERASVASRCAYNTASGTSASNSGIALNWNDIRLGTHETRVFRMIFSTYESKCTGTSCSSCAGSTACIGLAASSCHWNGVSCFDTTSYCNGNLCSTCNSASACYSKDPVCYYAQSSSCINSSDLNSGSCDSASSCESCLSSAECLKGNSCKWNEESLTCSSSKNTEQGLSPGHWFLIIGLPIIVLLLAAIAVIIVYIMYRRRKHKVDTSAEGSPRNSGTSPQGASPPQEGGYPAQQDLPPKSQAEAVPPQASASATTPPSAPTSDGAVVQND